MALDDSLELILDFFYRFCEDGSKFRPLVFGLVPSLVCLVGAPCRRSSDCPGDRITGTLVLTQNISDDTSDTRSRDRTYDPL
jgi:hypothetical protein